jgi:hypothetical protein
MPEFGIVQAIALTLLLLLMFGASLRLLNIWRNSQMSERIFKRMRSWWLWGDPLLRGWVRALAVGLIGGWLLVASTIAAALLATETVTSSVGFGFLTLLVIGLFVSLGMVATIMLFNRPRFAVPPHLRDQPGAVAEWRASGSRRRRPSAQ